MRRFFHRHRALIGYLLIVGVVVFAIELHHDQTTNELDRRDAVSCEQRNVLFENQRTVLHTLTILVQLEQSEDEHSAFETGVLNRSLERVREASARARARRC